MTAQSRGSPRHDGDLLFLTDTAYFSLLDQELAHQRSSKGKNKQDGLFLERLDSFIEGQLRDIESFASREQRSLDEVRQLVAIPHAKYIFSMDPTFPPPNEVSRETSQQSESNIPSIRSTLARMSNSLQLLSNVAGLDSLLLVVSPCSAPPLASESASAHTPKNPHRSSTFSEVFEASWIGGTELGKEFWMGLKGGGVNGARAFRVKCQMRHQAELHAADPSILATQNPSSPQIRSIDPTGSQSIKVKSGDVKTELNSAVRQALRSASGNPSAEMRWTKPASLEEAYNVRLVGWPRTVDMRNPSNNTVKDNRLLLDLVRSGQMKFIKRGSPEWSNTGSRARRVNPLSPDKGTSGTPVIVAGNQAGDVSLNSPPGDSGGSHVSGTVSPETLQESLCVQSAPPVGLAYPRTATTVISAGNDPPVSLLLNRDTLQHVVDIAAVKEMPKRRVEEQNAALETQGGRQVKRAKLDSTQTAG